MYIVITSTSSFESEEGISKNVAPEFCGAVLARQASTSSRHTDSRFLHTQTLTCLGFFDLATRTWEITVPSGCQNVRLGYTSSWRLEVNIIILKAKLNREGKNIVRTFNE